MMRRHRHIALLLLAGFVCLYLFTASWELPLAGDSGVMLRDAAWLLHHGVVATRPDGTPALSKYGLGQALVELPVALLPQQAVKAGVMHDRVLWLLVLSGLPAVLGALTNLLLLLIGLRLGYRPATAVALALLSGLTTMIWPYTQTLFADPTLGVLWLVTFYALLRYRDSGHRDWLATASLTVMFAVMTKIMALAVVGIFGLYTLHLVSQRARGGQGRGWSRPLVAFTVPAMAIGCAILWYNWVRYGTPLDVGYAADRDGRFGFNAPLLVGLFGLLLSPGKGVFWYNPTLLLGLLGIRGAWRRHRPETLVCVTLLAVNVLLYAKWWAWHGDWAWGPRYLVGSVPFGLLCAAPAIEKLLAWCAAPTWRAYAWRLLGTLLLVVGIGVQVAGLVVPYDRYLKLLLDKAPVFAAGVYQPEHWPIRDDTVHGHFIPEFSPLVGHLWMARCILHRDSPKGAVLRQAPPWAGLNPEWVPRNYNVHTVFHWNVWWMFLWQYESVWAERSWDAYTLAACLGAASLLLLAGAGWMAARLPPSLGP